MLASTLARPLCFSPQAIIPYSEIESRLASQRAAIRELGLAVPGQVRIVDPYAEAFAAEERRWMEGG